VSIKIIHIIGTLDAGGAETLLLNTLKYWNDPGCSQSVYYISESDALREQFAAIGVKTVFLNWKNELDFSKIPRLVKRFRTEKPHIVHSHLIWGNYWTAVSARLAGVPVFVETIHNTIKPRLRGRAAHRILRKIHYLLTDATICVGSAVKSFLVETYKQPSKKMCIIPNGVVETESVSPEAVQKIKNELGLSCAVPALITVANLLPRLKGYEVYIEALRELVRRGRQQFSALIVGAELHNHPHFIEELRRQVRAGKLDDRVTFLGYRSDIPELLAASDIFVLPSLTEGVPLAVIEAMRAGKPVIGTDAGGIPETVIHNETGVIVRAGNPGALADGIEFLLDNPGTARLMGEKGYARFKEHFTLGGTIRKQKELYTGLLKQKGILPQPG